MVIGFLLRTVRENPMEMVDVEVVSHWGIRQEPCELEAQSTGPCSRADQRTVFRRRDPARNLHSARRKQLPHSGSPHRYVLRTARATAKRSGAAASVRYEDEQLTIKVKTRTQEASREWMRRITGWLVVGHGPTNRASATVEEDETGTETDEERAAKKLDDLATAFERNRAAKRRHSEIHQGKTLWTEALRHRRSPDWQRPVAERRHEKRSNHRSIPQVGCRQLEAALRERMLVIVRTARRDSTRRTRHSFSRR